MTTFNDDPPADDAAAPQAPTTFFEDRGQPAVVAATVFIELPDGNDTTTADEPPLGVPPRRTRSRSNRSHRSSRSNRSQSSSASKAQQGYRVLFSSPAHYDGWVIAILCLPLFLILFQIIVLLIATAKVADFERSGTVWTLGWTMILIFALYMVILPKQVDIRSNGTIGIKTFLITHQFDDICHAYMAGLGPETSSIPFGTCYDTSKQVVVRRRGAGHWDVVVSPSHAEEFIRTLQSIITKLEIQRGTSRMSNNKMPDQQLTPPAMNPPEVVAFVEDAAVIPLPEPTLTIV